MASVIRLVVNARDNTRDALRSVGPQFQRLGRDINQRMRDSMNGIPEHFRDMGQRAGSAFQDRIRQSGERATSTFRETGARIRQDFEREIRQLPNAFRRGRQEIQEMGRETGRGFGNFFREALNGEIGGALRAATSNPIVLAAIGTLALAVGGLLGAAIAGALVLAIGGGFTALGVMIIAKSKETKEAWKKTLQELKPLFQDAASPLIPVVEDARKKFSEVGKEFAPHLKEAMEKAAPHLKNFLDSTKEGFRKMGAAAWDDIMEAFDVFLAAFGPQWEDFLEEFGKSLGALARTVSAHSEEMAIALRLVLGVINFLIDAVNFFANAWVFALRSSAQGMGAFIDGVGQMLDAVLGVVDGIIGAIESVAGIIGMEGPVRQARQNFNRLRESVRRDFDEMSMRFRDWGKNLDLASRKRKLEVDILSWSNQLAIALKEVNKLPPEKKTKALADISDLKRKIDQAKRELAGLTGKTVTITTVHRTVQSNTLGRPQQGEGGVSKFATGGVVGAATGGVRSNLVMVGERGPELISAPPGSHVRSNSDTRRILASGGGAEGRPLLVQFILDGKKMASALIDPLRGEIINRSGGNVQTALGKGR